MGLAVTKNEQAITKRHVGNVRGIFADDGGYAGNALLTARTEADGSRLAQYAGAHSRS